jgi:hypothetical protein
MISIIQGDCVSCEVVMYVIVAASVDANRILVDEERLILAARCVFIFWVGIALALEVDEQDAAG